MPSPFPGMDPYLEAVDIWPDLHDALAGEIRKELNRILPVPYYARLEMRQELGIVEEPGESQRIIPDIVVVRHPTPAPRTVSERGGVAVATRSHREISPYVELEALIEPIRHLYVEIRDSNRGHKLITLIEIVSPSNKEGSDRKAYATKQREVLQSDASLIELDLLRGGIRILPDLNLKLMIDRLKPSPAYVVLVNRAWRRNGGALAYQVFPATLREPLPCISVPLKEGEQEVLLDLQDVFDRAYDAGPYHKGAVDYAGSVPAPALGKEDAAWAAELTRPWREAAAAGS